MKIKDFSKALNKTVMTTDIIMRLDKEDFCPAGILVDASWGEKDEIKKVVTGVGLRISLIEKAIETGADAIIVHHPNCFWKSEKDKRLVGRFGVYMKNLLHNGISLFGYHMPLDMHPELGNNAVICRELGLKPISPMLAALLNMSYAPDIGNGWCMHAHGTLTREALDRTFPKGWKSYGKFEEGQECSNICICSGNGTSMLQEAIEAGYTVFITGEVKESTPILAEEYDICVIAAGHHRSEVFCVRELARYINEHQDAFPGVHAEFIDIDNEL